MPVDTNTEYSMPVEVSLGAVKAAVAFVTYMVAIKFAPMPKEVPKT